MRSVTALRLVARTLQRRLVASLVVIAVVAGVAGGIATGLVAAADRTRSAPERAVRAARVLVDQRYLLAEDAGRMIAEAKKRRVP